MILFWPSTTSLLLSTAYAIAIKDPQNSAPLKVADHLGTNNSLHNNPRSSLGPDITNLTETGAGTSSLRKKDISRFTITCNGNVLGYAANKDITNGVDYLRTVTGRPNNEAGKCGRVSCEYQAAIWWCNLNTGFTLTLDSFSEIADAATYVQGNCATVTEESESIVAGQAVNRDINWMVVVRQNSDC